MNSDNLEKKILVTLEKLETGQAGLKNDIGRIEFKIDKLDADHDKTKESQIRLEEQHNALKERFREFQEKHEGDKKKIYDNMDEKIKKSVKEAVSAIKIWVFGGIIAALLLLTNLISKLQ